MCYAAQAKSGERGQTGRFAPEKRAVGQACREILSWWQPSAVCPVVHRAALWSYIWPQLSGPTVLAECSHWAADSPDGQWLKSTATGTLVLRTVLATFNQVNQRRCSVTRVWQSCTSVCLCCARCSQGIEQQVSMCCRAVPQWKGALQHKVRQRGGGPSTMQREWQKWVQYAAVNLQNRTA